MTNPEKFPKWKPDELASPEALGELATELWWSSNRYASVADTSVMRQKYTKWAAKNGPELIGTICTWIDSTPRENGTLQELCRLLSQEYPDGHILSDNSAYHQWGGAREEEPRFRSDDDDFVDDEDDFSGDNN